MGVEIETSIVFSNSLTLSESKILGDVFLDYSTHNLSPSQIIDCDLNYKYFSINTGVSINGINFTGNSKGKNGYFMLKNLSTLTHNITYSLNSGNLVSWLNTPDINASSINVIEYYCLDNKILLQHLYSSGLVATINYSTSLQFHAPTLSSVSNLADYNVHPDKDNIELVYRQTIATAMGIPVENVVIVSVVIGSVKYLTEIQFPNTMSTTEINTKVNTLETTPVTVFNETSITNAINTIIDGVTQGEQTNAKEFFIYTQTEIDANGLTVSANTSTLVQTVNDTGTVIPAIDLIVPTAVVSEKGDVFTITTTQISASLSGWTIEEGTNELNFKYQGTTKISVQAGVECYYEIKSGMETYSLTDYWQFIVPGPSSVISETSEIVLNGQGYEQFMIKFTNPSASTPITTKPNGLDIGSHWVLHDVGSTGNLSFFFSSDNINWYPAVIFE